MSAPHVNTCGVPPEWHCEHGYWEGRDCPNCDVPSYWPEVNVCPRHSFPALGCESCANERGNDVESR